MQLKREFPPLSNHVKSKKKVPNHLRFRTFSFNVPGGDKRDRTADLLNAIQALSQLSYTPVSKTNITRNAQKCQEIFLEIGKNF